MIGTPTCAKCKTIKPKIMKYCEEHNIEFTYQHLTEISRDIYDILMSKNVKSAPAFLIDKGEDIVVVSGDNIFMELETI